MVSLLWLIIAIQFQMWPNTITSLHTYTQSQETCIFYNIFTMEIINVIPERCHFYQKTSFGIYIPIYTLCFLSLTIFPKRHRCAFWQVKRKETEKRYNTIYLSNAFSNIFWTFLPLHIWCSFHSKDRYGTLQTTFIDLFKSYLQHSYMVSI